MSTGIEILIFAPLLIPAIASGSASLVGGIASAGGAMAAGSSAGAVTVTGGSVVTTGAFTSGSAAGAAAGASTSTMAGVAVAGGAVLVAGAAGAALLAAQNLQKTYTASLKEYNERLESEQAGARTAQRHHEAQTQSAVLRAQNTNVRASESADLAFLRAGLLRLQKRFGEWPGVEPTLPGGCAQLLAELNQPTPDLSALFAAYEALNVSIAEHASRRRALLSQSLGPSSRVDDLKVLRKEVEAEITALRTETQSAPRTILHDKVRSELGQAIERLASLAATQPRIAEQGLQMLRGRVAREVALGTAREAEQREAQGKTSARLRELAGRISARSRATLAVLQDEDLASSPLARAQVSVLQTQATDYLGRLSQLLSGDLPPSLAPLEKLAREADALHETTANELRQLALQIYLESQVTEVFLQLGYQVSSVNDPNTRTTGVIASVEDGRGVEVRMDGEGNLSSEMVATSAAATEIEPHAQEKVCALMDEVFEALQARGCGIREKKRRHFKKGERSLRLVQAREKKKGVAAPIAAPVARRFDQ